MRKEIAMAARMNRRLFGMLSKRLDELGLDEIHDTRADRGKRWKIQTLLRATLGAMVRGDQESRQGRGAERADEPADAAAAGCSEAIARYDAAQRAVLD